MEIDVKQIRIDRIDSASANAFVRKHHYSGKVVNNSQLHFGAFYNQRLHGVLSFGPSLDKRKIMPLVKGTGWNEFIELNRMAFDDFLPRNSESRCISVSLKLIKKFCPHIKWIVTFADGCQCGDGTIYRAAGFALIGIKENDQVWTAPTGETFSRMSLTDKKSEGQKRQARNIISRGNATKGKYLANGAASMKQYQSAGFLPLKGFQLRYIYLLNKTCQLTVPVIPFARIDELKAGMYKGKNIAISERKPHAAIAQGSASAFQVEDGSQTDLAALITE